MRGVIIILLLNVTLISLWLLLGFILKISILSTLLFVLMMFYLILSVNSKNFLILKPKQYLYLLLILVFFVRLSFILFINNEYIEWNNGSNNGVMYVDGDWNHYFTITNSILSTWSDAFLSSKILMYYLPGGINGLVYSHYLAIVNYIFSSTSSFDSYDISALIQVFIFHSLRVIIVYNLSYLVFSSRKTTRLSTSLVAFDPYTLRWDLVLMKESMLSLILVLIIFIYGKIYYSRSISSKRLFFGIAIFLSYIVYLDRFYYGFFMLAGLVVTLIFSNRNKLSIKNIVLVLFLIYVIVWFNYSYIINATSHTLISKSSILQGISGLGLIKILLTPLPFNATINFDIDYLTYFGWIVFYPALFYFIIGSLKILKYRFNRIWIIFPFYVLVLVLGLMMHGGDRRRNNFIPVMYIVSAYAITRTSREVFIQTSQREKVLIDQESA